MIQLRLKPHFVSTLRKRVSQKLNSSTLVHLVKGVKKNPQMTLFMVKNG